MVENECTVCLKVFAYKSNLTRHVKNIHGDRSKKYIRGESLSIDFPRQGEMDEFDDLRQSGGLYGDDSVQSTSQTKFENADNQVDVTSQTDFDDDDRSMIVNDGSGSDSDDCHGDSDFSQSSDDDEEYDDKLRDLYNFWQLEMSKQMKKWSGVKLKKRFHQTFTTSRLHLEPCPVTIS